MREKLIAANWKMHKTPEQTREFFRDFLPLVAAHDRDEIVVCPTYLCIEAAENAVKGSSIAIGAQDVHWEKEGAFTGEINATMLVSPLYSLQIYDRVLTSRNVTTLFMLTTIVVVFLALYGFLEFVRFAGHGAKGSYS